MEALAADSNTKGNAHKMALRISNQRKRGEKKMMNTSNEGYICGLIFDSTTENMVQAEVISLTPDLTLVKPLSDVPDEIDGVYFATGNPGPYRLKVTATGYQSTELNIHLTRNPQERHIYLNSNKSESTINTDQKLQSQTRKHYQYSSNNDSIE